ncbi:MAG: glycerol kinase GlpK [Actinobacteria bacterium]|nr:glycerol kinase GlpK [Actinomycetota bacterium]
MADLVLSIDAGTTGITVLAVDGTGKVNARAYSEFPQSYPRPGWVEHDANTIWVTARDVLHECLASSGADAADIAGIGITNQRETTVVWERARGEPIAPAIVWQDRRTAAACDLLREEHAERIRERTGLVVDPYFSGTKIAWLLDNVDGARRRAEAGELAFGTIDTWLIWKMTGGDRHVTEPSNASRTMLYDLAAQGWDEELCALLHVPPAVLPEIVPSSGRFGETEPGLFASAIPISGAAGDQQAALFGQVCTEQGMAKNTYGTGSFVLMNTGREVPRSEHGLLGTAAWDLGDGARYALEGSIFVTGAAIQWMRDGMGIISDAAEAGPLAASVPDNGGAYLVPAFAGLGAPHWDAYARGAFVGLTLGITKAHLARAVVEAMAFQTRDVVEAMTADVGKPLAELRVDGGASVMDLLCQFQADQLGVVVRRPENLETTAMGAAFLAGLAEGVWGSTDEIAWRAAAEFEPKASRDEADAAYEGWQQALERSKGWARAR